MHGSSLKSKLNLIQRKHQKSDTKETPKRNTSHLSFGVDWQCGPDKAYLFFHLEKTGALLAMQSCRGARRIRKRWRSSTCCISAPIALLFPRPTLVSLSQSGQKSIKNGWTSATGYKCKHPIFLLYFQVASWALQDVQWRGSEPEKSFLGLLRVSAIVKCLCYWGSAMSNAGCELKGWT